jgi:hypothetical protein
MRALALAGALLALTGCANTVELAKALAASDATFCMALDANLYGGAVICRTNTKGQAIIQATQEGLSIMHSGTPATEVSTPKPAIEAQYLR